MKKEVRKNPNTLILLSTVFILYLFQSLTQYQIHTTIKEHKLILLKLIYQHLIVQTKLLFEIKLVFHMTVQHHIPRINIFQGSKSRIGIIIFTKYLMAPPNPLNDLSSSVIIGITNPFSLCNIDQNYSSVKKVLNFNHQMFSLKIILMLKVQP